MTLRELTLAVAGGLLLGSGCLPVGRAPRLGAGSRSPELEVPVVANGSGKERLTVHGRVTVVDFFASWCGLCAATLPGLERWTAHAGVRLVAVSVDARPGAARTAASNWHVTGPIGWDQGGRARRAFGVRALPTIVVTAPDGTITATHVGIVFGSTLAADIRHARAQDSPAT